MTKYVARVKRISRSIQRIGLPSSLSGDPNSSTPLPDAEWLVIEQSGASYFLYRYTGSGEFAGDTWHPALEDAQHQAACEYGSQAEDWVEVPRSVDDAVQFARGHFDLGSLK